MRVRKMKVPQMHKGRNKLRKKNRKNKVKRCTMRERQFLESWNKCTMKMRRQNRCSNVGTRQTRRVTKYQLSGGSRVLATLWYKMAGVRSGSIERTRYSMGQNIQPLILLRRL